MFVRSLLSAQIDLLFTAFFHLPVIEQKKQRALLKVATEKQTVNSKKKALCRRRHFDSSAEDDEEQQQQHQQQHSVQFGHASTIYHQAVLNCINSGSSSGDLSNCRLFNPKSNRDSHVRAELEAATSRS